MNGIEKGQTKVNGTDPTSEIAIWDKQKYRGELEERIF